MAIYTMNALPLKREEVEKRLNAGEEFILSDPVAKELCLSSDMLGDPNDIIPDEIPILFYSEEVALPFRVGFQSLPCACKNEDARLELPEVFIYVPLEILEDVPEEEVRFMIAREYMHTTNPQAFYLMTDEMSWKAYAKYAISPTARRVEWKADVFGLVIAFISKPYRYVPFDTYASMQFRMKRYIERALSKYGAYKQQASCGSIDSIFEVTEKNVYKTMTKNERILSVIDTYIDTE